MGNKCEVELIGVPETKSKKDALATIIHWEANSEKKIVIFDCGFESYGEAMVRTLNKHYFNDEKGIKGKDEKVIDAIIFSHTDDDHINGYKSLIESFSIKKIYINMPPSKNIIQASLSSAENLHNDAKSNDIPVETCYAGQKIAEHLHVLSPTKELFNELIADVSDKRVDEAKTFSEGLKNSPSTSNCNETSVVLYCDIGNMLFTGDAGVEALTCAISYAEKDRIQIGKDIKFVQIPHHGSDNNITDEILDTICGKAEEAIDGRIAFVAAAENSDNPQQNVVNAFIDRGFKVYATKGKSLLHNKLKNREGWSAATPLERK